MRQGTRQSLSTRRPATRNKYGNKKTTVDGFTFDSKAEAVYYGHLKLLKKAGEVESFKLQPRYLLQEGFKKNGKTHRQIDYIADFEVLYTDGHTEIIDIKGVKTEAFKLKQKLFERKYMDSIICLKYERRGFSEV
ncbi:DUF1064 domain-containing protein [Listeria weihenstephanensis]|uniref:DUF1064 domain-containing protein n=1 Tax=Listeria weihenstephanensis TaxID=1006155 RepID=A0A841Z2E4_9LIST|nr:DUF1064 domain-containing protein [Listeria weihenstephanensis]MBC1499385.1 DUF1064 domain-containing protein [Listeria weihenstephanensis]